MKTKLLSFLAISLMLVLAGSRPPQFTTYVSAKIYYNNYCGNSPNPLTYQCGLAKGISEVLDETPPIFANTETFTVMPVYLKVDEFNGTTQTADATYCATNDCYITTTVISSQDPFQLRLANQNYINGKLDHIASLKAQFPQYADFYDGYRDGCTQAFWFYGPNDLTVFQM